MKPVLQVLQSRFRAIHPRLKRACPSGQIITLWGAVKTGNIRVVYCHRVVVEVGFHPTCQLVANTFSRLVSIRLARSGVSQAVARKQHCSQHESYLIELLHGVTLRLC